MPSSARRSASRTSSSTDSARHARQRRDRLADAPARAGRTAARRASSDGAASRGRVRAGRACGADAGAGSRAEPPARSRSWRPSDGDRRQDRGRDGIGDPRPGPGWPPRRSPRSQGEPLPRPVAGPMATERDRAGGLGRPDPLGEGRRDHGPSSRSSPRPRPGPRRALPRGAGRIRPAPRWSDTRRSSGRRLRAGAASSGGCRRRGRPVATGRRVPDSTGSVAASDPPAADRGRKSTAIPRSRSASAVARPTAPQRTPAARDIARSTPHRSAASRTASTALTLVSTTQSVVPADAQPDHRVVEIEARGGLDRDARHDPRREPTVDQGERSRGRSIRGARDEDPRSTRCARRDRCLFGQPVDDRGREGSPVVDG